MTRLDGSTAVLGIIGDPVAQVKAPGPLTELLQHKGFNAVLVPLHVQAADVKGLLDSLLHVRNVAGLIVTVPHKQLVAGLGIGMTRQAAEAGAVNLLRKTGGGWEGDLKDGTGFVAGLVRNGVDPRGLHAAMAGAGGAGNAIAFALAQAGVASLAIRDVDAAKQAGLVARLQALGYPARNWDGAGPQGQASGGAAVDLLVNATPVGMKPGDPLPVPESAIAHGMTVADVIMEPRTTPLLALAQQRGCKVVHGQHMMDEQLEAMTGFFGPAIRDAQEQA